MEKGRAGLLCEKDGGSTRRKGELDGRRLEMALMRLWILGEPRLELMGVELVVVGEESALRNEGMGEDAAGAGLACFEGEATRENLEGLKTSENAAVVLHFLLGELKVKGSMFSVSSWSSKTTEARRLPVEDVRDGFRGEENVDVGVTAGGGHVQLLVVDAFHVQKAYRSACSSRSGGPGVAGCRVRRRADAWKEPLRRLSDERRDWMKRRICNYVDIGQFRTRTCNNCRRPGSKAVFKVRKSGGVKCRCRAGQHPFLCPHVASTPGAQCI